MSIEAVNMRCRLAVLRDGQQLPITNMFDGEGHETDDPDEARTFVCGPDRDGMWWSDRLDTYDWNVALH